MKPRSRLALGLLLIGLLLAPPNIFSSGSWVEATFILQHAPDDPLKAFDGGKLGILRPKFDRRYLVIAYRYLEQRPLTAQERHSLGDERAIWLGCARKYTQAINAGAIHHIGSLRYFERVLQEMKREPLRSVSADYWRNTERSLRRFEKQWSARNEPQGEA